MCHLVNILDDVTTVTFDCYGTLIDWRAGQRIALRSIFEISDDARLEELVDAYVDIEAQVEAKPYQSYRDVLAEVTRIFAEPKGVTIDERRARQLAESIPNWPPFKDTGDALQRLKSRFRLGILSNIDRSLFTETAKHFPISFDFVITAEDVRSYKPNHGHFDRLLAEHGPRESILHVAQSLMHDGEPANELGIAYVWINRYNDENKSSANPLGVFPNLASFAELATSAL